MAEEGGGASEAICAALGRLTPEGPLGVAVSGGGDSMALLAIAAGWAARRGSAVRAVTVDHGLRAASAGEAALVAAHCARIGVAHRVLKAGPLPAGNLQAAAREARYRLMAGWAREAGVRAVALGHTMDDQAETLLMRLARGAGAEGLAGMAPRRDWRGVAWIRPMLGVRRAALRDWLRAQGVGWVDDPTNDDESYDRVKARRALPLLEPLGVSVEGLAATARTLARQRRVLARAAADTAERAVRRGALGEARLSLGALRQAERDTALRVFAGVLACVAGRAQRPRFRALEPALTAVLDGERGPLTLAGCLVIPYRADDAALVCREPAAVAEPVPLTACGVVWDHRWRVRAADPPGGLLVGALGATGLAELGRAAKDGRWLPPQAWEAARRQVRETAPAVFGAERSAPLAVPLAGYVTPDAPAGLRGVRADPLAIDEAAP